MAIFALTELSPYLVKYRPLGHVDWLTRLSAYDEIVTVRQGLAIDANQNLYMTGRCLANTALGSITNPDARIFIAKMELSALSSIGLSQSPDMALYPNPVAGFLIIDFDGDDEMKSMRIFDLIGSLNSKYVYKGSGISVDVSGFWAGVYLVEITTKGHAKKQLKFVCK